MHALGCDVAVTEAMMGACMPIFEQMLQALRVMRQNFIIHHDLKPQNFLVVQNGPVDVPVVKVRSR
jgi:serine/threonine protein kinase